jgi:hypothetical protein
VATQKVIGERRNFGVSLAVHLGGNHENTHRTSHLRHLTGYPPIARNGRCAMDSLTLQQALNFCMPNGKALRDMSADDWRQWVRRFYAEYEMLEEMDERHITNEQDQRAHARADRLADLQEALRVIFAD